MELEAIKIEGLYNLAYRAYQGTSFSPEKRATDTVAIYERELNEDLKSIPESEKQRYIDGYKRHLTNWLSAKSRCLSSMITGPSRFPVERNRKALDSENNRLNEFIEWRDKVLNSIAKKIEDSKPEEQKISERWERLKAEISQKISWGSVANTFSMIERLAYNGEVELVENCIELITKYNNTHSKPFITSRHKMWELPEIAKSAKEKKQVKQGSESLEAVINDVRLVNNYQADRVQLFFDGKPTSEVISLLKSKAFKWSPTNKCWQRQLTTNAIEAAKQILKIL